MAQVVTPAGLSTLWGQVYLHPISTAYSVKHDALVREGTWKMLTIYDSKTLVSLILPDLSAVFDISDSSFL